MRSWAVSLVFYTYFFVSSALFWLLALAVFVVTVPLDRRRRVLHLLSCFWAYHYVWLWPFATATFEGVDRIRSDRTYVIIANHQSWADILLLYGLFKHFKWVSKKEVFKVPFIGWNMGLNDYVRLERGTRSSIAAMMRKCRDVLARGSSVMIFPEGTRSPDGEIHPFKPGAVALAVRAGVEIVPIVIDGTADAIPKHGLVFRKWGRIRCRLRVLEPVAPDAAPNTAALTELLHERMRSELAALRGTPPSSAGPGIRSSR